MKEKNSEEEIQAIREELKKRREKKAQSNPVKTFIFLAILASVLWLGNSLINSSLDGNKRSSKSAPRIEKKSKIKIPFKREDQMLFERIGDASLLSQHFTSEDDKENTHKIVFSLESISQVQSLIEEEIQSASYASFPPFSKWKYHPEHEAEQRFYYVGDNVRSVALFRLQGNVLAVFNISPQED